MRGIERVRGELEPVNQLEILLHLSCVMSTSSCKMEDPTSFISEMHEFG